MREGEATVRVPADPLMPRRLFSNLLAVAVVVLVTAVVRMAPVSAVASDPYTFRIVGAAQIPVRISSSAHQTN